MTLQNQDMRKAIQMPNERNISDIFFYHTNLIDSNKLSMQMQLTTELLPMKGYATYERVIIKQ